MLERFLASCSSGLDAEDVIQESLLKAFQNLHRFDSNYRFSTWLYTIAFRVARDQLRRHRRWARLLSLGRLEVRRPDVTCEMPTEVREEAENVWELAKQLLSADQYAALWLRYGEELEIEEISSVLGRTPGAVRVLLHRSRLKLLEQIQSREAQRNSRRIASKSGGTQ